MISGEYRRVPLSKIWSDRDNRHRKELTDIDSMKESFGRLGQIHNLVVGPPNNDGMHKLICGERRFAGATQAGWDGIWCLVLEDDDYLIHRTLELEENVRRHNLNHHEIREAVTEYHQLRFAESDDKGEKWTQAQTGKAMGLEQPAVSGYLKISDELAVASPDYRERILKTSDLTTCLKVVERSQDAREQASMKRPSSKTVLNLDFCEWAPTYDGPKFQFIHCDFPFGINTDKRQQGTGPLIHGGYDDSPDVYWNLLDAFCKHYSRFCDKYAHLMFWYSMKYHAETIEFLRKNTDFKIDPFPLIWGKADKKGIVPDHTRGPRRIYETALFGSRGDRRIQDLVENAVWLPTESSSESSEQHLSVKPEPVLRHFFRMFVNKDRSVFDPTCGSGSALKAAMSLKATHILGLEKDAEFAARASRAIEPE
jgi:hypothetical protein